MAKGKKKYWFILGVFVFLVYIFAAARPVPPETVLAPRWLSSLESGYPVKLGGEPGEKDLLIPFELGGRFGFVGDDGSFKINKIRENYVSLSGEVWAEYEALPSSLVIRDPEEKALLEIENPQGYPFFLEGKTFILGSGQDSIKALDSGGNELWSYDFPAPLTCVDAASGFILAGTLDGTIELLNSEGRQVIPSFEPGGSRLAVILGCAISKDATKLAIISGIDNQRFILMEQSGDRYRVVYHEFLSSGYRRPLNVVFVDNDSRVVFEREGGAGIYDISSRTSSLAPLKGEIAAIDESGDGGMFFAVSSESGNRKHFAAIRYPSTVIIDAPFKSKSCFISRNDSRIYLGGDSSLLSLEIGKK